MLVYIWCLRFHFAKQNLTSLVTATGIGIFFIKKETLAQVFSVNFAKFLRTPFFTEHLQWLLLLFVKLLSEVTQKLWLNFDWRKFYLGRNNDSLDSIETGHMIIDQLLPWSDEENCSYITLFQLQILNHKTTYPLHKFTI